jgi:phage terminase large subunit-like protein
MRTRKEPSNLTQQPLTNGHGDRLAGDLLYGCPEIAVYLGWPVRQGYRSMSAPTRELEKLIVSRRLAHGGNPVTRWMAANVAVAQDPAGNLKPAKDKSTERIDGIVAIAMAIGRAMLPEAAAPSYQMLLMG